MAAECLGFLLGLASRVTGAPLPREQPSLARGASSSSTVPPTEPAEPSAPAAAVPADRSAAIAAMLGPAAAAAAVAGAEMASFDRALPHKLRILQRGTIVFCAASVVPPVVQLPRPPLEELFGTVTHLGRGYYMVRWQHAPAALNIVAATSPAAAQEAAWKAYNSDSLYPQEYAVLVMSPHAYAWELR